MEPIFYICYYWYCGRCSRIPISILHHTRKAHAKQKCNWDNSSVWCIFDHCLFVTLFWAFLSKRILTAPHCPTHSKVRSAVFRRVAELAAWSMKWATRGEWPDTGFEGVPFATTSERSKRCGEPLAHGWKFLVLLVHSFFETHK